MRDAELLAIVAVTALLLGLGSAAVMRRAETNRVLPSSILGPASRDPVAIFDHLPVSVTITDARRGDVLVHANRAFEEMTGRPVEDAVGRNLRFLQGELPNEAARSQIRDALAQGDPVQVRLQNLDPDGTPFWNELLITPLRDDTGRTRFHLGMQRDVTDAVRNERELHRRQLQHYALAATSQAALATESVPQVLEQCCTILARTLSAEFVKIVELAEDGSLRIRASTGLTAGADRPTALDPQSMSGHAIQADRTIVSEDFAEETRFAPAGPIAQAGARSGIATPIRDGEAVWGAITVASREPGHYAAPDADFVQSMAFLIGSHITRSRQRREVRSTARFLDAVLDSTAEAIVTVDAEGRIEAVNRAFELVFALRREDAIGRSAASIVAGTTTEPDLLGRFAADPLATAGLEGPATALDAHDHPIPVWLKVTRLAQESVPRVVASIRDMREQQAMQTQLVQAQKMEAVGQLTGGVAHDFNNLLTVVLGNLELLSLELEDAEHRELLDGAIAAGRQGADLNRRLLAFARRQTLQPSSVDVPELLDSLGAMLRRMLGELYQVGFDVEADLPAVHVDRAQLESALLNLAVNARDAMPGGGRITIAAGLGAAGDRLWISVSDTGPGIAPELRERVVEPFYTTKPSGQGTGLGLSMVFGFLRQSGGEFRIEDAEGGGARMRLELPLTTSGLAVAAPVDEPLGERGPLHVLLVEDEQQVREATVRMIRAMGHSCRSAGDARSALALLEEGRRPDVVLTDTVMPGGMSGIDLAHHLRRAHPDMGVVLTSGYARSEAEELDTAETCVFINKPFGIDELRQGILRAASLSDGKEQPPS